ncbi:uncharacterized protein LOC120657006 [Panicum virgatum]|uniref:uncharacterized protein LOC120657006 n=1 Tax=Panicum virgatum TaxID=38727 RepID=UPI0019D569A6|nr:uncharacterized protein LOC120657006 [Panicum virgatum]
MRPPLSAASRRARFPLLLWGSRLVHDLRDAPESWSEILHLPQGRIREGPEIQIPHQPGSPEYTLHRSISEKFTIRRLFACLNANSSNMVPERSLVMEPISNNDVRALLNEDGVGRQAFRFSCEEHEHAQRNTRPTAHSPVWLMEHRVIFIGGFNWSKELLR